MPHFTLSFNHVYLTVVPHLPQIGTNILFFHLLNLSKLHRYLLTAMEQNFDQITS